MVKPVSKKYAKSVDRLKVCFTAAANDVAETGLERFFVRIINPVGETMAVENLGSGIMKLAGGSDEVRYTQVKEVDYDKPRDGSLLSIGQQAKLSKRSVRSGNL